MLRRKTPNVNNRLLKEFNRLDQMLNKVPADLIPMNKEELGLLSFHQDQKKTTGWVNRVSHGIITSIYQEHLAQYMFRSYYFAAIASILYVRTTSYKFGYIFGRKKCDIFINDQYAGSLNRKGELVGPKGRRVLLRLHQQFDKATSIKILDREVGLMNNLKKDDLSISRMLAYEDTTTIEEVLLVISICFLRNIMTAIPHPSIMGYMRT